MKTKSTTARRRDEYMRNAEDMYNAWREEREKRSLSAKLWNELFNDERDCWNELFIRTVLATRQR